MPVSRSIRRVVQPRRPQALICCFLSSLKTLLTTTEDILRSSRFHVLADCLQLAGFEVTPTGRFWVTPEGLFLTLHYSTTPAFNDRPCCIAHPCDVRSCSFFVCDRAGTSRLRTCCVVKR